VQNILFQLYLAKTDPRSSCTVSATAELFQYCDNDIITSIILKVYCFANVGY